MDINRESSRLSLAWRPSGSTRARLEVQERRIGDYIPASRDADNRLRRFRLDAGITENVGDDFR